MYVYLFEIEENKGKYVHHLFMYINVVFLILNASLVQRRLHVTVLLLLHSFEIFGQSYVELLKFYCNL